MVLSHNDRILGWNDGSSLAWVMHESGGSWATMHFTFAKWATPGKTFIKFKMLELGYWQIPDSSFLKRTGHAPNADALMEYVHLARDIGAGARFIGSQVEGQMGHSYLRSLHRWPWIYIVPRYCFMVGETTAHHILERCLEFGLESALADGNERIAALVARATAGMQVSDTQRRRLRVAIKETT